MEAHSRFIASKSRRFGSAAWMLCLSLSAASPMAGADDKGKATYDATCALCHGPGIAGAPKFGDKPAWSPRIDAGKPALYDHALKGFQGKAGVMPAKGGNPSLSDDDVKAAVDYMISIVK